MREMVIPFFRSDKSRSPVTEQVKAEVFDMVEDKGIMHKDHPILKALLALPPGIHHLR
jgi:hypothetical protein